MNSETEKQIGSNNSNHTDQKRSNNQSSITVFKGALIGVGSLILALIITFGSIFLVLRHQYRQFLSSAELSHQEFLELARTGWKKSYNDIKNQDNLVFLILGVDSVANRTGSPPLTDTIMLVSLQPDKNQVITASLPRDLWSIPYQTKINALYTYGLERNSDNPTNYPTQIISSMTDLEIDYTLVLSLEQLGELIKIVNGVTVKIEQGFTDNQFPKSDVDITTTTDPDKLYETVKFKQGEETMNAERALKYIRSRHSEGDEGTDTARAKRQQQIIDALINKLSNPRQFLLNPSMGGKLFRYYQQNFDQYFPTVDLFNLLFEIGPASSSLQFTSQNLPIYPEDEAGIIYHPQPSSQYQKQWIYLIRDQAAFQEFFKTF